MQKYGLLKNGKVVKIVAVSYTKEYNGNSNIYYHTKGLFRFLKVRKPKDFVAYANTEKHIKRKHRMWKRNPNSINRNQEVLLNGTY